MRLSVLALVLTACGRIDFDPPDGSIPESDQCFPILGLGHLSTYGIDTGGRLWAWGDNYYGQLGTPGTDYEHPFIIPDLPPMAMVAPGFFDTAAVDVSGRLHRIGFLAGTLIPRVDTNRAWRVVDGGNTAACGILEDTSLWCWGYNDLGQLGTGSATGNQDQTFEPMMVGVDWRKVAAGTTVTCAIKRDDRLYCWGANDFGQLGQGSTSAPLPFPTLVDLSAWHDVDVTESGVVAVRSDRTLWGWGYGPETGGAYVAGPTPQQIGVDADWESVHTRFRHVCARKLDDSVWCWGQPTGGPLGPLGESQIPLALGVNASEIQTGGLHTCLRIDGVWQCFGGNGDAQLGTFDTVPRAALTPLCP